MNHRKIILSLIVLILLIVTVLIFYFKLKKDEKCDGCERCVYQQSITHCVLQQNKTKKNTENLLYFESIEDSTVYIGIGISEFNRFIENTDILSDTTQTYYITESRITQGSCTPRIINNISIAN